MEPSRNLYVARQIFLDQKRERDRMARWSWYGLAALLLMSVSLLAWNALA